MHIEDKRLLAMLGAGPLNGQRLIQAPQLTLSTEKLHLNRTALLPNSPPQVPGAGPFFRRIER